jgi:autotransporter-associated beta strand protein/predicted outer membrane repeat protein
VSFLATHLTNFRGAADNSAATGETASLIVAEGGVVFLDGGGDDRNRLSVGAQGNPTAASIHLEEGAFLTVSGSVAPRLGINMLDGGAVAVLDGSFLSLTAADVDYDDGVYQYNFLNNKTFVANAGSAMGGALYNDGGEVYIESALFQGNIALYSGAILNDDGLMILENTEFRENGRPPDREGSGGAIRNNGDGMMLVTHSKFIDNDAGGAAGAIENTENSYLYVSDSLFEGNKGESGAAIANSSTVAGGNQVLIEDSVFQYNDSISLGGALFNDGARTAMAVGNGVFTGNRARLTGGAVTNFGTMSFTGDTVFTGNRIYQDPGTMVGGGGAVDNRGVLNFEGPVAFSQNSALGRGGGAIHNMTYTDDQETPLAAAGTINFNARAEFTGNQSSFQGGAIVDSGGTITFNAESVFTENTAAFHGGALMAHTLTRDLLLNKVGTFIFNAAAEFTENDANMGGAAYLKSAELYFTGGGHRFTRNTAAALGGAIGAADGSEIHFDLTSGTTLFSGNKAAGNYNSVALYDKSLLSVNPSAGAVLDMLDPMSGNSSDPGYPVEIVKKGQGLWNLGGESVFTAGDPSVHYTRFSVEEGTLRLLGENSGIENADGASVPAGSVVMSGVKSLFTLKNGAVLVAGGGNKISLPEGKIVFENGSVLSFDVANYVPAGADGTVGLALDAAQMDLSASDQLNFAVRLSSYKAGVFDLLTAPGKLAGIDLTSLNAALSIDGYQAPARMSLSLEKKTSAPNDTLQLQSSMIGDNMNLSWNGGNGEWNYHNSTSWLDESSNPVNFMPGDAAKFSGTGGQVSVAESGAEATSMLISSGNYVFSGGSLNSAENVAGSDVALSRILRVESSASAAFLNEVDFAQGMEIDSGGEVTLGGTGKFADSMEIRLNGALIFDTDGDYVRTGLISGAGSLVKKGAGSLTLDAVNTYAGATTVEAGLLIVGSQGAVGGGVEALSGAALNILGRTGGSVAIRNGASLLAGSGGLIEGGLTMEDGSTLRVSNGDQALTALGTTSLGSINPVLTDVMSGWERRSYEILRAGNPNDLASFAPVELSDAFITYTLAPGTGEKSGFLLLTVESSSSIQDYALSPNQRRLSAVIGNLDPDGRLYGFLRDSFSSMSAEEIRMGLNELFAPVHHEALHAAATISVNYSQSILAHAAQTRGSAFDSGSYVSSRSGGAEAPSAGSIDGLSRDAGSGLWASASGYKANYDGEHGISDAEADGYAFRLGYDAPLQNGWILGAALGFDKGKLKMERPQARADVASFTLGVYGGRNISLEESDLRFILGLAYSAHRVDSRRTVTIGPEDPSFSASYRGRTFQAFAEAAWNALVGENSYLEPFLNFTWENTKTDAFNESDGIVSLRSRKNSRSNSFSNLGLRFSTGLNGKLALGGHLAWKHSYGPLRGESVMSFQEDGESFRVVSPALSRDALNAGANLNLNLTEKAALSLGYDALLSSKARQHSLTAMFSYSW